MFKKIIVKYFEFSVKKMYCTETGTRRKIFASYAYAYEKYIFIQSFLYLIHEIISTTKTHKLIILHFVNSFVKVKVSCSTTRHE
jgi:hypothetical protein